MCCNDFTVYSTAPATPVKGSVPAHRKGECSCYVYDPTLKLIILIYMASTAPIDTETSPKSLELRYG